MYNFQNLELFSVNAKIFVKFGLIGLTSRLKQVLVTFIPIISCLGQLLRLCITENQTTNDIAMNFFFFGVDISLVVRLVMIMRRNEGYVRFFQLIETWYRDIERNENPEVLHKFREITDYAKKLTRFCFCGSTLGTIFAIIYPLSFGDRKFVVEVYYPFFDVKATPFYEIFFILQAAVLAPSFCVGYLPFTNLFLISLMFGELVLLDLRVRLNNIRSEDGEVAMLRDLKKCIEYHQKIIDNGGCKTIVRSTNTPKTSTVTEGFRDDLEELVTVINFFDVAIFGLMFCMMFFFMSMVDDMRSIITSVVFVGFSFYLITITYYFANKFTSEAAEVCYAAYNLPWYDGNMEMRKCALIMIARSQRPLNITAGGLWPMTLETLQAILKMSYSYFSMLHGLNQQ